jgi:hypothetical protein
MKINEVAAVAVDRKRGFGLATETVYGSEMGKSRRVESGDALARLMMIEVSLVDVEKNNQIGKSQVLVTRPTRACRLFQRGCWC